MALEIANNRVVKLEAYYDEESSSWKLSVSGIVCESSAPQAAYRASVQDMDLSANSRQANLDDLVAEALVQLKAQEGVL